jgi:hypothetical protein
MISACGCGSSSSSSTTLFTQSLWVANGTNVVEFTPSQLNSGGSAITPQLVNNSVSFGAPQGVVFDSVGDLWVIDGGTVATGGTVKPALLKFTASQLSSLGATDNPVPAVIINSPDFTFPQQAVLDGVGDMYLSDSGSNAIFLFTAAQLTSSQSSATPSATILSVPAFSGPLGITFDAADDLWIANNSATSIYGFKASSLPTTTGTFTLAPYIVLSDDGSGSIQAPWGLAFDSSGDLWSSNANSPNTVVEFAQTSLVSTGSPSPAVTLSPFTVGGYLTLSSPNGIAFDNLGDLSAVSSASPFGAAAFTATQLSTGGAIAPTAFLVGSGTTLNAPAGCAFGPVVD